MTDTADEEEEFKQEYAMRLYAMLAECMWGDNGYKAMVLISSSQHKTITMHAVNADAKDAREILLSAAEVYRGTDLSERVIN
jgi:NRPS condensation-like uncharacterized protein